mmetsp:Transcript_54487/g.63684  ORF Transcript_54487/g.63684 Transcript_54487/m.63684 type:complete len:97 (+) Transcript_54487:728-1018(+)
MSQFQKHPLPQFSNLFPPSPAHTPQVQNPPHQHHLRQHDTYILFRAFPPPNIPKPNSTTTHLWNNTGLVVEQRVFYYHLSGIHMVKNTPSFVLDSN